MAMSMRDRVGTLEDALKELANAGRRTERSLDRLSREMKEFKDEMRSFRDEMSTFKEEMSAFKDEMTIFKDENRREYLRMNQQWGALANKMGTFVKDMVLPNFPHILERYFRVEEVDDLLVRRRKPHPVERARRKEFDLLAWTRDTVFWNETKSNPTVENLALFVEDDRSLAEYFPELAGKQVVKIASALSMPEAIVDYLTANRCYAMILGDETMDLVNFEAVGAPE